MENTHEYSGNTDALHTKIRELEQQLEIANNDLHAFSYKISHDLHAPLRAIFSYMEMIKSDYEGKVLDENALRMIYRVMSNADEMKQMLDGLLEFVRCGKKELNHQMMDMNAVVDDVWQNVQQRYPERKLDVKIGALHNIKADEELIKKVWTHLIANAVKFTKKKELGRIEIYSSEEKGQITYTVKDNGDGFDMSFYDKLFGVFQKLHHKSDFEGAGIGLAIVQRIVQRHEGKTWAEATVNEGASFYFSLPGSR